MKRIIILVAGVAACAPVCVFGTPPFREKPDWESSDQRTTFEIAVRDFNSDGFQVTKGERKTGDGLRHVFYLEHFPALTITGISVNGTPVSRSDYCFDARAGWFSLKDVPPNGARVEVDYKWSDRLDFFAGNCENALTDNRDAVYFNRAGTLEKTPGWLSVNRDETCTVAAADYDADGDVDVVIGGYEFIKIYKNTGAGLEGTPSWNYEPKPYGWPGGFAWGDVDNDGYLELAVADCWLDDGRFYVFKNNAGTLESSPSWSVKYEFAAQVAWGDLDGDGDMDLAGSTFRYNGEWGGYAYVFKNNDGTLESTHYWRNAPPKGKCNAVAWGDVNADGWLDLIKGICGGAEPLDLYADIYYSERGVLPTVPNWESEWMMYCYFSVLIDCDGDKRLDLVQSTGGSVIGYFQRNGGLERKPSWEYGAMPDFIFGLAGGDVNGDALPDIAIGCEPFRSEGGKNKVFLNKGNIGVDVKGFVASSCARGVALRWEVSDAAAGFNLYRAAKSARAATEPRKINKELITGRSPYRYLDAAVEAGNTYQYWLEVVPLSGPSERHGPVECTVKPKGSFALAQNAPNPARTTTTFAFSVPAACEATLTVYDIAGRKVMTAFAGGAKAGENELAVDVSSLTPGVYTYRLEAGGEAAAKRMVVIR